MLAISPNTTIANKIEIDTIQTNAVMDGYKTLNLVGHGYIFGYLNLLPGHLQPYGVTTDVVAPENPILDHEGTEFTDIDYLCSEVTVSDYDILWMIGDFGENNISTYPSAISVIVDAYNEGLVIVAFCSAPLALASADIIDGKNISGTTNVKDPVEAAGATYKSASEGICVDLPFISCTDVNSQYLYLDVAFALGFDLTATETPTETTTPTTEAAIPISSLAFILSLALISIYCKKKRH